MSFTAAILLLMGGSAEPATQSQPVDQQNQNDPIVCQSFDEIGSRLKRRKVCMRRSEWRAQHQQEKLMIDRTQVQRGLDPAG